MSLYLGSVFLCLLCLIYCPSISFLFFFFYLSLFYSLCYFSSLSLSTFLLGIFLRVYHALHNVNRIYFSLSFIFFLFFYSSPSFFAQVFLWFYLIYSLYRLISLSLSFLCFYFLSSFFTFWPLFRFDDSLSYFSVYHSL